MNCKEFQKLPIDEQRRILADEAKEFAERQLPTFTVRVCPHSCVDQVTDLKAEVSRLTDCLEETIDELLCGNKLYAELTDRQNDATALLDSAQGTINELREELADRKATIYRADKLQEIWYWQGDGFDDLESITCPILIPADTLRNVMNVGADTGLKLQASEQARLEAERGLQSERIRHQQDVDIDSDCRRELQSRLSRAEDALAHFDAKLTRNYWHDEVLYCGECGCAISACESHTVTCDRGRIRVALQPQEGEKK